MWIVVTLRSDLYELFQASAPLLQLRDGGAQIDVTSPTRAELAEMIERPAAAAGLSFDRDAQGIGLDEALASAADQPGALPLLQLTLDALFQARDKDANVLTFAAYDALGRLPGVIERSAEAAFAILDPTAQAALPDVLSTLVDLTDDGVVTARAAPVARVERTPGALRLSAAFSAARLLVLETVGGTSRLRVAHEALLLGWPRAAALIEASREALRTRGRIEAAARTWQQEGRDGDFLLPHGRPLAEALEFVAHHTGSLDGDSAAFVQQSAAAEAARELASRAAAERELRVAAEAQQARADAAVSVARNTRRFAAGIFALLVLASGVAGIAFVERQQAQRRTAEAERNFTAALGAGASLVDTANAHLTDGGMSRAVAQSLLDAAETNLGGLIEAGSSAGPKLRDTQVQLLSGFSKVELALCDSAGARARATQAVELAADTAAKAASSARTLALVRALDALGLAAVADGDRTAAAAAYRRAEQTATGGTPEMDAALRSVHRGLAAVIGRTDRLAAVQMFRDDLAWQDRAAATHPDDPAILGQQVWDLWRIAELSLALKHLPETQAATEREQVIVQHLTTLQPANMEWQHALVQYQVQKSRLSGVQGDPAAALAQAEAAAESAARVSAHDPANAYWQRDVLNAQLNLYNLHARAHDYAKMAEAMRPALAFAGWLTGPHAGLACQGDAALLFKNFGLGLLTNAITNSGLGGSDLAAASQAFEKSLSIRQAIANATPDDPAARVAVAEAPLWLARSFLASSRPDAGLAEYQATLAQMQTIPAAADVDADGADVMAALSSEYGAFQAVTGKIAEALATQEAVRSSAERRAQARPEAAVWQHVIIVSQLETAKIRAAQHDPVKQLSALQDAVARAERVAALPQKPDQWRADLIEARQQRGAYALASHAPQDGIADLQAALSLAGEQSAADPANRRWPAIQAALRAQLARAGETVGKAAARPD